MFHTVVFLSSKYVTAYKYYLNVLFLEMNPIYAT